MTDNKISLFSCGPEKEFTGAISELLSPWPDLSAEEDHEK